MKTAEQTAYELSEFTGKYIREYGRDAIGVWDVQHDGNICADIEAINKELAQYDDNTPDERGKGYKVVVESINKRYATVRIRYVKL